MTELKGKVAVVTGAGQGMGRAIALALANAGSNLVLAEIRANTLEHVKKEIEKTGREVLAVRMDVSKWEDAGRMAKAAMKKFGRIDILVNDAAISPKGKGKGKGGVPLPTLEIDEKDWDNVMNVNLKGVFNVSKAVAPFMIKQRSGTIVNITSVAGLTAGARCTASAHYVVSKAGAICLTKVLARELAPYNITVNNLAPGRTETEMVELSDPDENEYIRNLTPLRRFAKPSEIAGGVLFLVSEAASFITGETLVMDGGRTMH